MPHDNRSLQARLDPICDDFERVWKQHDAQPALIDYIQRVSGNDQDQLAYELILLDRHYRHEKGKKATQQFYHDQLPDLGHIVQQAFAAEADPNRTRYSVDPNLDATIDTSAPAIEGDLHSGERIKYFGDYEIIDEIARGGMGVVYRAKQISLNRIIALKMILSGHIAGEDQIRRFQLEAEAAANLDHPCIVPIYDIGEHDGQHYFSMKLIEGKTLSQISGELKDDHARAIELVAKVADAMHHAHQRGILHRDLKPGNILLDSNDQPMVTDFGLARNTQSDTGITQTGAIVGTPGFMSPEQASGSSVTTAADIYSLGAILYQLLCGRPPHQGSTVMKTVLSVINDEPEKPRQLNPDVHPDLELVCLKCLEKDAADRYSSAAEFAGDLRAHLAGQPVSVRTPSVLELTRLWLGRNYGNVVWVPIIAVVVGVVSGFSLWTCTFGQDMSTKVAIYENFPASDRPWLAQNWEPVSNFTGWLFIFLISSIGWATAKLVKTKNLAGDLGAGLSVGLLAGLLAFISGMGAVMLDSVRIVDQRDNDLLMQLAVVGDKSYTQDRIVTQYPTLEKFDGNRRAWLLHDKHIGDQWSTSVTGISMGAVVCLFYYGLSGILQTWVAGPLVRRKRLAEALLSYSCFSVALVLLFFIGGGEVSMYFLLGSFGGFDWQWPALCIALAIVAMFSVVRRWKWPIQLAVITALFGTFIFTMMYGYSKSSPPRVAMQRTEIKKAKRLVRSDSVRRDYALRLTRAHHNHAGLLNNIGRDEDSLEHFRQSISAIESGKSPGDFDVEERVLYSQLLWEAGSKGKALDRPVDTATWLGQHAKLFQSSAESLNLYAQSVLASGQPESAFVRDVSPYDSHSFWRFAGQVRAIASAKDTQAGALVSDAWLRSVSDKAFNAASETSEVANWSKRKNELAKWIRSRQRWELFGRYKIKAGLLHADALDQAYPPEMTLLAGGSEAYESLSAANKTINSYTGATVDLIEQFGETEQAVCYGRTTFTLNEPQKFNLRIGSDDSAKVWIDGKMLMRYLGTRGVYEGNNIITLKEPLAAGEHTIVVKVLQGEAGWGFVIDASDLDGWPIPLWHQEK